MVRERSLGARLIPSPAGWVASAISLGAAAVVVLWLVHTPDHLVTAADGAIAVARLSGLLAGYAVLVLVVLMARLPTVERAVGADRLSRWHAWEGRYTTA